jgi:hypothetical protein
MPISHSEAQDTLRDISATARASATSYGYRVAAPHFLLWGIIWFIAWTFSYLAPQQNYGWLVLDLTGIVGSFLLGRRARAGGASGHWGRKYGSSFLVIALFVVALFAIMPPLNALQISAFFPLLVALFYCLAGIWAGALRLVLIGALIAGLTLIGFFVLPQQFVLWMAFVGGGSLIFAGLWLRSA